MAVPHGTILELNLEIDAATVGAVLVDPGPFPSPTPETRELQCADSYPVTITDETGLIDRCDQTFAVTDDDAPLFIENPDGDERTLRLTWTGGCGASSEISGRFHVPPVSNAYELWSCSHR